MRADNPEMAEYEAPQSGPERVVRVAANTGDPEHDKRLVQYAKATIQSGDGPFRNVVHPMTSNPQHVASAVASLEQNPDWQPYIKLGRMIKEAPGKEHMKGVSPKRNRQYEHIKEQLMDSGKSEERAKEEAARTVNKQRAEHGETKEGADRSCPECGADVGGVLAKRCPNCGHNLHEDPDPEPKDWEEKESGWHEAAPLQQFQQDRGDYGKTPGNQGTTVCPNCGTLNMPGATKCAKCGTELGVIQPAPLSGGPSNAYSNPYTGNPGVTGAVKGEMSKWHLADLIPQAPGQQGQLDTQNGQFNDHRDVGGMSPEQSVGHERLVNIVVDEMNKAIQGGGVVDATLVNNLVQWLVDKFGQDADSAQAIVDAATKQAQTSDGRLDNTPVVPDPAEQAIQPAQGDVLSDPNQVQNNGAFSHVRTPSGHIGHIVERWEDMYGEKWAMVVASDGFKESVYEDELATEEAPASENTIEELQAFIDSMEPVEATVASIKARIANVRILKQEIRRYMANPRLSFEEKLALDQMDANASVEMLELTDAVPGITENEKSYLESQPGYQTDFAEHVAPTMNGVEELQVDEPQEPEWTNEALEAFLPEEAEIMVNELSPFIRSDPEQLEAVASSYIDRLTAGHSKEDRAYHRSRFIAAVATVAADYTITDEPDTIEQGDWDGPAEELFV